MDKQTLKNHIEELIRLRNACSSQLDIGALTKLDDVIASLVRLSDDKESSEHAEKQRFRVLQAIALFVRIMTDIKDWL